MITSILGTATKKNGLNKYVIQSWGRAHLMCGFMLNSTGSNLRLTFSPFIKQLQDTAFE